MQITVIASTDGISLYSAVSSAGQVIAERSRTPLLDSARAMMVTSTALSTHWLEMFHEGSTSWALRGIVGKLAGLDVHETGRGPKFCRHRGGQQAATLILGSDG